MAKTITSITVSTDTFETLISQVNTIIDTLGTEIVTANSEANGSITIGNTFIVGIFGSNTIAVGTALRGGNVQASAPLSIISNVAITATEKLSIGNSTINAVSNSLSLTFANSTTSTVLDKSILKIGTTSVNAVVNSTAFTLANSTVTFSLQRPTAAEVTAGNYYLASDGDWKTINADINISGTPVNNELAVWVNATTVEGTSGELTFDAGTLQVGTASVNTKITSTAVTLANSTVSLQIVKPTAAQISDGDYFLNATGSWTEALKLSGGTVTGAVTISNTLSVTGAVTLSGTSALNWSADPVINFDTGDQFVYSKTSNRLNLNFAGSTRHYFDTNLLEVGYGLAAPTIAALEIGGGRSGDGDAVFDMISDTTYTDYGLRFRRAAGLNGAIEIRSRGTGTLSIITNEAANISFGTTNTTRLTIQGDGNLDFKGGVASFGTSAEGSTQLVAAADRPGYIAFYEGATRMGYFGYGDGASGTGRKLGLVAENDFDGFGITGKIVQSTGYGAWQSNYDDDGTQSSGTYTPDPYTGNFKKIVNGGAFTLAAPTASGVYSMNILIGNNGTPGAITMSNFDVETGDSFTTTAWAVFMVYITKNGDTVHAHVVEV